MMDSSTRSFNCETRDCRAGSMMRRKKSRFLREEKPSLFRSIFFAYTWRWNWLGSDDWTSNLESIVRSFRCRPTTIVSSHSDNGNNGERLASSCRERRLSPSFRIQIPASRASSCVEWFRRSVTSIHYVKRSRYRRLFVSQLRASILKSFSADNKTSTTIHPCLYLATILTTKSIDLECFGIIVVTIVLRIEWNFNLCTRQRFEDKFGSTWIGIRSGRENVNAIISKI